MTTPNLGLDEISVSQANKYATHNLALRYLDALVMPRVADKDLTSPPAHVAGNMYIVGAGATGDWSGQDDNLAISINSTWEFVTPETGFIVYVLDESVEYVYGGSSWAPNAQTLDGAVEFTGIITPSSISVQQDNYNPSGLSTCSVIRQAASADVDITGLTAVNDGGLIFFINISNTYTITLKDESASSTAANRFDLPDNADVAILPNSIQMLMYDATTSRWRATAGGGGGGSGDVVGAASSTDNAIVRFDGTTGKLIQNTSGATLSDNANLSLSYSGGANFSHYIYNTTSGGYTRLYLGYSAGNSIYITGHNSGVNFDYGTITTYSNTFGGNAANIRILPNGLEVARFQDDGLRFASSKGIMDSNDNMVLLPITAGASAINYLTGTNATTGNPPILAAAGTNTNIGLNINTKGTGLINFNNTTAITGVLDEDNMDTDSATHVPTQQSVKAHLETRANRHLVTLSPSATASQAISNTYFTKSDYIIIIKNLIPATDGVYLVITASNDNGSSYASADYQWAVQYHLTADSTGAADGSSSASSIILTSTTASYLVGNAGTGSNEYGVNGYLILKNLNNASYPLSIDAKLSYQTQNGTLVNASSCGITSDSAAGGATLDIDNIKIAFSSGNITSGTIEVRELPNGV